MALGWRTIGVVVAAGAGVCLGAAVLRPFAPPPPPPDAKDIAAAWNASISRLGILPIFPPQEDLQVGDVWAVVEEVGGFDAARSALIGRSIRIGHVDLRAELAAAQREQIAFAETGEVKAGETFRRQDRWQSAAPQGPLRIGLTLTAFPGITIRHGSRAEAALGAGAGRLFGARADEAFEEFRIPVAETYGVPTEVALAALFDWCRDRETAVRCTDAFARNAIAFALDDTVLRTGADGAYDIRLSLRLVSRVFLMREVVHRTRIGGSVGVGVALAPQGGAAGGPAAPPAAAPVPAGPAGEPAADPGLDARVQAAVAARDAQLRTAFAGGTQLALLGASQANGREIVLQQTFQRPLAFGFRAVSIRLKPAQPGAAAAHQEQRPR